MKTDTVIIGGGVVGLFTAWYLTQNGEKVTVIDKGDFSEGCSYGNAGMIVPSHVIPLASPGMIAQGVKWMFRSDSPFYVRPRFSSELFSWGWKFYRSANQNNVDQNKTPLRDLSLLSKSLYQDLSGQLNRFDYEEKGLLMLFQNERVGEEEREAAAIASELGLDVAVLSENEIQNCETGAKVAALGAVHYKSDAHLSPNKLMAYLKESLENQGVVFHHHCEVLGMDKSAGKVQALQTNTGTISANSFVIATGAWSSSLAKFAGDSLSLLPGKGYSFMNTSLNGPTIPSILCEGKVAVTPMNGKVRFGGTMEITHVKDSRVNLNRVKGIVDTVKSFYPEYSIETPSIESIWSGFRPCSPDGLPYIGRSENSENLFYATGHGMMGLSLGPATGKLTAQLVQENATDLDLVPFNPNR